MKKINNKILIITLVALVGIFALSRIFRSPGLESNVRKELAVLDTATITEIRIVPSKAKDQVIKLNRDGNKWNVLKENSKFEADASTVKSMLALLVQIEADRMMSRKKEKWDTFDLGEGSTQVSVYAGTDQQASFFVGKSGFNQTSGGGYTYVRLSDEDEVYSVNGFLDGTFNRTFDDWRNKSFLRISRDLVTRITFTYPADSSFVLEKRDTIWHAGNTVADESKANRYLSQLTHKNLNTFADDFTTPGKGDVTIQIESAAGTLGTIEAWRREVDWVLRSSLQPEIYFSSTGSSVDKDLLVGLKNFVPENK